MEQVNVAIADDNERILDLLEEIINMDKELHVVGKAKNGEEMQDLHLALKSEIGRASCRERV